jgi:hypothetical protein
MTTDRRMGACSSPAPSELLTGRGSVAETSACNVRMVVSAASAGKEAGCRNCVGHGSGGMVRGQRSSNTVLGCRRFTRQINTKCAFDCTAAIEPEHELEEQALRIPTSYDPERAANDDDNG